MVSTTSPFTGIWLMEQKHCQILEIDAKVFLQNCLFTKCQTQKVTQKMEMPFEIFSI
jgi:hypothetical protein